jgi:hypothetical protein
MNMGEAEVGLGLSDLVMSAVEVSWLSELTQIFLCSSSWIIREKTLFMGGRGSISKIWALTVEKESFKPIKNCRIRSWL